jgi:hypothetical protein
MMMQRTIASAILICCITYSAYSQASRYVTITITNQTPEVSMAAVIEVTGKSSATFVKRPGENIWEYKFPLSDKWFSEADIKITWQKAYLNPDGSKKDFSQRVALLLRYNFPSSFDVPVYFFE